jgi:hypothetical protein
MATATPTDALLERGFRNGAIVGHDLRILSWSSVLAMALSLAQGARGFRLDLGFILFAWIGGGLLRGTESSRRSAAILCGIHAGGALALLGLVLGIPGFSEAALTTGRELAAIRLALVLLLAGPPFALLMSPATRAAFRTALRSPPPGTALRTIYYALGSLALAGLPAILDSQTDRTTL